MKAWLDGKRWFQSDLWDIYRWYHTPEENAWARAALDLLPGENYPIVYGTLTDDTDPEEPHGQRLW